MHGGRSGRWRFVSAAGGRGRRRQAGARTPMRARSQGMRSGSRGVDWSTNTSRTPDESSLVGPGILRSLGRSSGVRWPSAGGHVPSASKDVRPWRRPLSEGGRGRFTYTMPALRQAGVVLAERLLAGEHVELQRRRDAREFKRLERRQSSSRHVDAPFAERTRSVAWFGSTTLTSRPRRVSSSATKSRAWRIASRLEAGEGGSHQTALSRHLVLDRRCSHRRVPCSTRRGV